VRALQSFQQQMQELQELLHDEASAEFCIVSIPTALSIAESERLMRELQHQGIAVRRAVINRLIDEDSGDAYLSRLARGQQQCLDELKELSLRCDVSMTEVPLFDVEVRAVYGLRAISVALFDA